MVSNNTALLDSRLDYDFRGALWGMSREDVKDSELSTPSSESATHLSYHDRVLELDTVVGYHFIDGSLVEAGYAFREIYGEEGLYIEQYGKFKEHLCRIYGNPLLDEDINTYCQSGDGEEDQELESLMYLAEWLTERSIIRMILMGDEQRCDFGLLHRSRGHVHIIEQTEKSVKWGIS